MPSKRKAKKKRYTSPSFKVHDAGSAKAELETRGQSYLSNRTAVPFAIVPEVDVPKGLPQGAVVFDAHAVQTRRRGQRTPAASSRGRAR